MPNIEKLSIALTGEQAAALRAAVETGEYATTSEVIREAVRDWQLKRELRQEDLRHLRQAYEEGLASGPGRHVDLNELRRDARRRLEQARKADRAG